MTRSDDETVPIEHRGLQVVPNTFYPKASKGTLKPSDSNDWFGNLLGVQACMERGRILLP